MGRFIDGFSPGFGFTGIAVAVLANNHPMEFFKRAFIWDLGSGIYENELFSRDFHKYGKCNSGAGDFIRGNSEYHQIDQTEERRIVIWIVSYRWKCF